jgi:hypothetical protein
LKVIVGVHFTGLHLDGFYRTKRACQNLSMLCEIQILCRHWLKNKKQTSLSYKILRASSFIDMLYDFSKYLTKDSPEKSRKELLEQGQ